MLWNADPESLNNPQGLRMVVYRGQRRASYDEVISSWRTDSIFRQWFNTLLATSPFAAFRWETPPVTVDTVMQPFEFVLLDNPRLGRPPDPTPFRQHFAGAHKTGVASFPNIGGDAVMIVPCPIAAPSAYGHIAAFVRDAPEQQQQALWFEVGEAMAHRLGDKPVWLSTAGAGVSWLHVRLDDKPKYYGYTPYRC